MNLRPDWPNTTDRRVRQSIDRGSGNDANWADTDFAVWLDVGSGFARLGDGTMTDSTPGGNPDSGNLVTTFAGMAANGSIYNTTTVANGTDDVVLRFAPLTGTAVHEQFFGIDGCQLTQVPEPTTGLLGLLGLVMFLRRRR